MSIHPRAVLTLKKETKNKTYNANNPNFYTGDLKTIAMKRFTVITEESDDTVPRYARRQF